MNKKTIVFDFDGVIHQYSKGWQGLTNIYDEPVDGIKEVIQQLMKEYEVIVVSTRCTEIEGLRAVREWLQKYNIQVTAIKKEKPPAFCYIDDRAICFEGNTTDLLERIRNFKTYQENTKQEKNNLVLHAENELKILLEKCEDEEGREIQKVINNDILEVVKIFSEQGHSGFSAAYAINIISQLLKYEPVTALTGEENEWNKVDYGPNIEYQNKRCSRVFKDSKGQAYDVEGKVFSDNGGKSWYQSKDSRVYIQFPYVPHIEKIILDNKEE